MPLKESSTTLSIQAGKGVRSVLVLATTPSLGDKRELKVTTNQPASPEDKSKVLEILQKQTLHRPEANKAPSSNEKAILDEELDVEFDCSFGSVVQSIEVAAKDGRAEVIFPQPLEAGHCIIAIPVGDPPATIDARDKLIAIVDPIGRSYGRVNIYAHAGFAVGSSGTASSQTSPYIGILMDGVMLRSYVNRNSDHSISKWGASFNFFIEGRLTQAPTTNVSGTSLLNASNAIANDQVQSQLFQVAWYAPVRTPGMSWTNDGAFHSFYLAPIIKYGLQWVKNGIETRTTTVRPNPLVLPGTTINIPETRTAVMNTNAHPFYGSGLRLGFSRYKFLGNRINNNSMRRETLGGIDFIYGHQHAFRTPFEASRSTQRNPASGLDETTIIRGTRIEPRLMLEGRVKVPLLPLFVGVEASRNWARPDAAVSELRFFLSFRADLLSVLSRSVNLKTKP